MSDSTSQPDQTGRFTGRVENYRQFRSRFPRAVVHLLKEQCELAPTSVIADLGAGTGMFSELFLENGNPVFAVEPNAEMRAACKELFPAHPHLMCVDATAEATRLPNTSVDFVTVARAFHWFDREKCRTEFLRILRPRGWLVIASLGPQRGSDAVASEHETLLFDFSLDLDARRRWGHTGELASAFFSGCKMRKATFTSVEELDFVALWGHMLSISVMPQPGHARFPVFREAVEQYFARHQSQGKLALAMRCELYFGRFE